jgi:spore coat polysaccharide biosynthesis protein SpsF
MKAVGIIQARMGSTRLPGKVLKPILGVPMLALMMERLSQSKELDEVVIATSTLPQDDVICEFAHTKGYLIGRGSESDVLGRYYQVAKERKADIIARMTGDCPLIDPDITDTVVRKQRLSGNKNDVTSNVLLRTFPRGFDTEVMSFSCLERVIHETQDPLYREHVTNYMYDFPEKFTMESVTNDEDCSDLRLTVDTEKDFELVKLIFEALYPANPRFRFRDIKLFLDENPELKTMNAYIKQTKIFRNRTIP